MRLRRRGGVLHGRDAWRGGRSRRAKGQGDGRCRRNVKAPRSAAEAKQGQRQGAWQEPSQDPVQGVLAALRPGANAGWVCTTRARPNSSWILGKSTASTTTSVRPCSEAAPTARFLNLTQRAEHASAPMVDTSVFPALIRNSMMVDIGQSNPPPRRLVHPAEHYRLQGFPALLGAPGDPSNAASLPFPGSLLLAGCPGALTGQELRSLAGNGMHAAALGTWAVVRPSRRSHPVTGPRRRRSLRQACGHCGEACRACAMSWKGRSDRGRTCIETHNTYVICPSGCFASWCGLPFLKKKQCIIRIAGRDGDGRESSAKGGRDMLCFGTSGEEG